MKQSELKDKIKAAVLVAGILVVGMSVVPVVVSCTVDFNLDEVKTTKTTVDKNEDAETYAKALAREIDALAAFDAVAPEPSQVAAAVANSPLTYDTTSNPGKVGVTDGIGDACVTLSMTAGIASVVTPGAC